MADAIGGGRAARRAPRTGRRRPGEAGSTGTTPSVTGTRAIGPPQSGAFRSASDDTCFSSAGRSAKIRRGVPSWGPRDVGEEGGGTPPFVRLPVLAAPQLLLDLLRVFGGVGTVSLGQRPPSREDGLLLLLQPLDLGLDLGLHRFPLVRR